MGINFVWAFYSSLQIAFKICPEAIQLSLGPSGIQYPFIIAQRLSIAFKSIFLRLSAQSWQFQSIFSEPHWWGHCRRLWWRWCWGRDGELAKALQPRAVEASWTEERGWSRSNAASLSLSSYASQHCLLVLIACGESTKGGESAGGDVGVGWGGGDHGDGCCQGNAGGCSFDRGGGGVSSPAKALALFWLPARTVAAFFAS